jgi:tryptophan synthase alpha chain
MKQQSPLTRVLEEKKHKALSLYIMADFPERGDTVRLCRAAEEAGADFLEIGMPFSDPIADGPTIQRCSERALKNGFSIAGLFSQLTEIRSSVSIPLVLMGYVNPVLQYGIERFCEEAERCGINGVILPDMPVEEYAERYQALFNKHNLSFIFLVTSRTSSERIRILDSYSSGFLYLVSSDATTGGSLDVSRNTEEYFERISAMNLTNPLIVGFGISNHITFSAACRYAHGAIVASALLRTLEEQGTDDVVIKKFVASIRG